MEDPFKNTQEKSRARTGIAGPEDWQAYKELRLLAITGKDAEMFGVTTHPERVEEERARSDEDWQGDLSRPDMFVILSWEGTKVIGMVRAQDREDLGAWYITSGYSREDSRGKTLPTKVFKVLSDEVRKRGGRKLMMGVKATNDTMIRLATLFGFKKSEKDATEHGFYMELNLPQRETE